MSARSARARCYWTSFSLALATACNRAPESPKVGHQPSTSSSVAVVSARPISSDEPPPLLPDGCFSGLLETERSAHPSLADLAERCAPGMRPLGEPRSLLLQQGSSAEVRVHVDDASRCLRALAAGADGVRDLELALESDQHEPLGEDTLVAPFALVDSDGPVCARAAGGYVAKVRSARGTGNVSFGVWRAE